MRALVVVKSIDGGTGTFLENLVNDKSDIKYKVLVLERPRYRKTKLSYEYLWSSGHFPEYYSLSILSLFNFIKDFDYILKKLRKIKPDVVLSVDFRCNIIVLVCKSFFLPKTKVITTDHIDIAKTLRKKSSYLLTLILKNVASILYNRADVSIGVSKRVSLSLKKEFRIKNNVLTIYNGLNCKKHKAKSWKKNTPKIIVTVARLVEQKDHRTLIEAFRLLKKKLDVKLLILSDGPEKKNIESLIKKYDLTSSIELAGWVKSIDKYFKMADIFVLSSKREGFAYVLIEAMSWGLPVVSTDTPYGPREVLEDGKYGILTPVGHARKLSESMYSVINAKKTYEYYSKKSLKRASFFSDEKMAKQYIEQMEKVINKPIIKRQQ